MKQNFTNVLVVFVIAFWSYINVSAQGAVFEVGPLMNRTRIVPTAATLNDGRIVLFGGREEGFVSCSYADIYDPALNAFTEVSMNNPHDATCVIKLQDGRYFVMGGSMNSGVAPGYNVTEIYDPSDDSFSLSTSMTYSRMIHNGAQLSDGKILVAGAWYNDQGAASPEILDLEAGTSVLTNPLNTPRAGALVLPCADGNAMVIGGFGSYGSGNFTSVEEYDHTTNSFSVFSEQIVDGETDWLANSYSLNRPSAEYRLADSRYIFLASRSITELEYILVIFDPVNKTFTKVNTTTPLLGGATNGSIYDFVVDITNNKAYLLGLASGAVYPQVGIIGVDLATGYVQHPSATFDFPGGEYLFPTMAFTQYNGKILLSGVSSNGASYFYATNKTYLITPDEIIHVEESDMNDSMLLFPNPSDDRVWINFNSYISGRGELQIIDQTGRVVLSESKVVVSGEQQWNIEMADLVPGYYTVSIYMHEDSNDAFSKQAKLIVR